MPKSSATASICSHGYQYPQANKRLAYLASTPSFFSLRALDGTINSRIPLRKSKFLRSTGQERQEKKVEEERLGGGGRYQNDVFSLPGSAQSSPIPKATKIPSSLGTQMFYKMGFLSNLLFVVILRLNRCLINE